MIYAPRNEFCMIWVIFVYAKKKVLFYFLESVGGGRGVIIENKSVCFKMFFGQFQVCLGDVFFFSYWKIDPRWPPPPPYWNFPIILFFLFLKPSLIDIIAHEVLFLPFVVPVSVEKMCLTIPIFLLSLSFTIWFCAAYVFSWLRSLCGSSFLLPMPLG